MHFCHAIEKNMSIPQQNTRPRLLFLDGLRGLAAFYVVLAHCYQNTRLGMTPSVRLAASWMQQGHWAVDVFIVLSGYCLMLPVARSATGQLSGGVIGYLKRRARRILPPYYVALAFSLALLPAFHALRVQSGQTDGNWTHSLSFGVVASHLLLLHNLSGAWIWEINAPMWSVATEWQIYFVFPLLLLPVWRRFGVLSAVVVGFAVGMAPHLLLHHAQYLDAAYFWYVGLFALGMAGAVFCYSAKPVLRMRSDNFRWGMAAWIMIAVLCLLAWLRPHIMAKTYLIDALVGTIVMCVIVHCGLVAQSSRSLLLSLFESRFATVVGTFSYSLYLIHILVLDSLLIFTQGHHWTPESAFATQLGIGVPFALGISYLFHLAFERPFMGTPPPRTERQAEIAAVTSPAP